jgi:D-2-hydroxyacid dehydrogenase (NADP+)
LTTRLLLLLDLPKEIQAQYYQRLTTEFPQLLVDLAGHHSEVGPSISTTDILVTFAPMLTDPLLRKAEKLKWVQALGTGVDNLVDQPSLRSRVIISNIHGIHGAGMSEAAIMAMLALSRNFSRIVRNQDQHEWQRWPARLLDGKIVGIFGVGAIGEALAPRCKALGMTVVGISSAKRAVANFDQMYARDELANAVTKLDYLIVLTPYSSETRNILNSRIFAAMKPSAYFINLARGGVVEESALVDALEREQIAGAALDVFSQEPLPPDHAFWSMKNVIVMPHLAGFHDQYADQALPVVVENIRKFLAGDFTNMLNIVRRGDELD